MAGPTEAMLTEGVDGEPDKVTELLVTDATDKQGDALEVIATYTTSPAIGVATV